MTVYIVIEYRNHISALKVKFSFMVKYFSYLLKLNFLKRFNFINILFSYVFKAVYVKGLRINI